MKIAGLAPLQGYVIGEEPEPVADDGFSLVPRTKGPKRLLLDMLRQDPEMAELLKKLKMKGSIDGSMGTDYVDESR